MHMHECWDTAGHCMGFSNEILLYNYIYVQSQIYQYRGLTPAYMRKQYCYTPTVAGNSVISCMKNASVLAACKIIMITSSMNSHKSSLVIIINVTEVMLRAPAYRGCSLQRKFYMCVYMTV